MKAEYFKSCAFIASEMRSSSEKNQLFIVKCGMPALKDTLLRHLHLLSQALSVLLLILVQTFCQMWAPNSPLAFCHLGIKEEVGPSASLHNSGPLHALPNPSSSAQGEITRLLRRKCEDHPFSNSPSLLSPDGRLIV